MIDPSWIEQARTAGALLVAAPDPLEAIAPLCAYLESPDTGRAQALEGVGISPKIVHDFRELLPRDRDGLERACELGAAWVIGRRSAPATTRWAPVVTGRELDRATFDRRTAETLVTLIIEAKSTIRLFTPFLDPGGIGAVAHALAAATARGVSVHFGYWAVADRADASRALEAEIAEFGDPNRLLLVGLSETESFPHLKLLVTDGRRAYIGSANLTYAGLTHNVEVGAVVEGEAVKVYERLLDTLLRPELATRGESS